MSKQCLTCEAEAGVKCNSCAKVLYCSEEHRKADSTAHKSNCRPYVVESNDKYGRYLVTSRDVKQGEIILREAPVTVGPRIDSLPTCLECFALLYPPVSRCSRCKFTPLCAKCSHNTLECDFFSKLTSEQRIRCLNAGSPLVLPLKVLLRCKQDGGDSEQFQRILDMEPHMEARRGTGVWRFHLDNVVEPLQVCGVVSNSTTDIELVQRICGILDVNSFEVRGAGGAGLRLRGVYVDAAMMAHDCLNNVHLSVDDNFVMTIRACVDIPAGQPVFYNYTDPLQPSSERQKHLWEGKYFICECSRCSDPTELGTYLSAIVCPRCRSGRVLPCTDADHWQCDSCKHTLCDGLISTTVIAAKDLLESVDRTDPDQLEQALLQLSRSFAPSHSLLLDLRQSIVAALRDLEPTEQRVRRKVDLCRQILPTIRKIEPGISRLIGITLYELHIGLVTLAQDFGEAEMLKEAEEVLKEAVSLLLYEPTISPEGDLARQAMAELKTLKHMIAKEELKKTKKSKSKK